MDGERKTSVSIRCTNGWREKDKKCTHETYIKMYKCIEKKTTSVNIKGCKDRQTNGWEKQAKTLPIYRNT